MKELADNIIRALADHPGQVVITALHGSQSEVLEVRCHSEDMGRVIGKNGKTISAIRLLLNVVAARHGRKVTLEITE